MSFFFYIILAFMFFILPIFISVDGAFYSDRGFAYIVIKLYGVRILKVRVFFNENEIAIFVNKRKKSFFADKQDDKDLKSKKIKRNYLPLISAIKLSVMNLDIYAGGDPQGLSLFLGTLTVACNELLFRSRNEKIDEYRIRILPCYVNDRIAAKFSITFFTSPLLILVALVHTIKGDPNAKRNNDKLDG